MLYTVETGGGADEDEEELTSGGRQVPLPAGRPERHLQLMEQGSPRTPLFFPSSHSSPNVGCQMPFPQLRPYPTAMPASPERVNGRAARRLRGRPAGPKGVNARAFCRTMVHETGKGAPQVLAA